MLRSLAVGVALCALPATAFAQDGGVLTKAPALLKKVEAIFPSGLLDAGAGGTVVMLLDLTADGAVSDATVIQSAGEAFDREALAAIRQCEFSPAEVDGRPAAVRLQFSYTFFFRPQLVEVAQPGSGIALGVVNFAGTIVERGTRDPVGGALITVGEGESAIETSSDDRGHFEVKDVPPGTVKVTVVAADSNAYVVTEDINANARTEVTYYLRKKVYGTMETVVRDRKSVV